VQWVGVGFMIDSMTAQPRIRLRIPFSELWSMRIEHPYSLLVRADGLAWTCGQCPLAPDGSVLAPDDLVQQAEHVEKYIERLLDMAGLSRSSVGKLVLYHGPAEPARTERMLRRFQTAFPGAVLVPVGTPFFYYPGMCLEADVHAAERRSPITHSSGFQGLRIESVDAGELIWVSLKVLAEPTRTLSAPTADMVRDALRSAIGVSADALLADHWFVGAHGAGPALEPLREAGLVTDPGAAVGVTLFGGIVALGELTFARERVAPSSHAMSSHSRTCVLHAAATTIFGLPPAVSRPTTHSSSKPEKSWHRSRKP